MQRWRTGVILQFEGCKALVKADVQDKKVFISIKADFSLSERPPDAKRRLLGIIRSNFERIHADIRNLLPNEMVPLPGYPKIQVLYDELLVMEKSQERDIKKVVEGKLMSFSVLDLLNGVDLEGARKDTREWFSDDHRAKLFYSYSHKDEVFREELETHLTLLERQNKIKQWHDKKIGPGDEWKNEIDENLAKADIVLLLISAHFIKSNYCWDKEMTPAFKHYQETGKPRIIPVIVRDGNYNDAEFMKLQVLPHRGLAVELWENRDSAWRNVSEGIEEVINDLKNKTKPKNDRTIELH